MVQIPGDAAQEIDQQLLPTQSQSLGLGVNLESAV